MAANEMLLELREKIRRVNDLWQSYSIENRTLKEELKTREELLKQKENELKNVKAKYETLKLAKSISGVSTGSEDASEKINLIVRDLDRCIGLLNR